MNLNQPHKPFRVLHTADWHLGKMLGDNSREREHGLFLDWLLAVIREQKVDVLIVAGDVFDSANPPQSAVAQYYNFLSQLTRDGGCTAVIIAGNHDSPAHLEAPREVLKPLGVRVVGLWPEDPALACIALPNIADPAVVIAAAPFLRDRDLRIGVAGQTTQEISQALVRGIQECYASIAAAAQQCARPGVPILATGHLTVAGSSPSESEREIHIGGLGAVGAEVFSETFAYVALGHLHRPQSAGRDCVRYSGSPIPLSFGEITDQKEVRLLEFAGGRLQTQQALRVPQFRPLIRLAARHAELKSILDQFVPPQSDLPAWLEVEVEDPVPGEDLYETARACTLGKNFEVLRVVISRSQVADDSSLHDDATLQDAAELLSDPAHIFQMRLHQEPGLSAEDREALSLAFSELCSLLQEQERAAASPTAP